MKAENNIGPLSRAIDHQSAEWLEANAPDIFDALDRELQNGLSSEDIRTILRRKFGNELREPFVVRVMQAAEYISSKQPH